MAVTAEAQIMELLFARLASLVLSPAMPIAWPNIVYTPPASQKYLRVIFVPNFAQRLLIGSNDPHRNVGLLQVSVQWPKNDGETKPREIAGAIINHFPADLRLGTDALSVRITKRPEASDLIVEDVRVQVPVMIEWECWA